LLNCNWKGRNRLDNGLQSPETAAPNLDKYQYDFNGYPCYYKSITMWKVLLWFISVLVLFKQVGSSFGNNIHCKPWKPIVYIYATRLSTKIWAFFKISVYVFHMSIAVKSDCFSVQNFWVGFSDVRVLCCLRCILWNLS